nr:hypothetical protein [Tanacetum cinerariifolium]
MVKGIMINEEWVTDPQQVKTAFLNFYKEKFDDHASTMNLSPVTPQSRLNEAESSALECGVTMDEVKAAVWECRSQKAPRLRLALKDAVRSGLLRGTKARDGQYNLSVKSNVYGIRVSLDDIVDMARATGCTSVSFPFIYLGLPIGSNMNLIANWQSLIDRFCGKLSSWKASWLSIGDAGMDGKGCKSKGMWQKIVGSYSQLHERDIIPIFTLRHKKKLGGRNEEALSMVAEIDNVSLSNQLDSWHWSINPDGIFTVSATRNHIDDCLLRSLSPSTRWSKFLPRKVNTFIWRLVLDRLPNHLNLSIWGLEIPTITCPTCNARVESNDDIFFGCDTATVLWRLIRVWVDVGMPMFSSCSEWFQWAEDWRASKESKYHIATSRWLKNQPSGSVTTSKVLKTKFLNKYCPPAYTIKKMEEINNFQQESDESLFCAWERFKELLIKCPQHYLTDMQEVILFYNGLDVPTQQILDSKGSIPSKTAAEIAIQEMAEYS